MKYALAYDIGTTGVKTCLFEIGDSILDCDGDHISLVEDYIEDVTLLVGH